MKNHAYTNPLICDDPRMTAIGLAAYLSFLKLAASDDLTAGALNEREVLGLDVALRVATQAAEYLGNTIPDQGRKGANA